MQIVYRNFNEFKSQCHSEREMLKPQELNKQIIRLQKFKIQFTLSLLPSDLKDIDHFFKVYKLAVKQIERMKMLFTKPSLVKEKLVQIFDNQRQQFTFEAVMEKASDVHSSQIEIPTFKNTGMKQNVIDTVGNEENLASPGLRHFFQKKQAQLMNRSVTSNFKSVIQVPDNKSFSKSNNRSASRQQPSNASRSNSSSFMKNSKQVQLKKILEENRKMKTEYDKKIKMELELNQFEKALLKEEKNRYMLKIEELQSQLENLYRANYRLKEQVQVKQKELKSKSQFQSSSSFRNVDQNPNDGLEHPHDYYQPYVMKTKHNDLKRLNMKCHSEFDQQSIQNKSNHEFFFNGNVKASSNGFPTKPVLEGKVNLQSVVDVLGNQLEKELKELQKQRSRSNHSHVSSKKWSRQYNPGKYQQVNSKPSEQEQFIRVLRQEDLEDQKISRPQNQGSQRMKQQSIVRNYENNKSSNLFQKKQNSIVNIVTNEFNNRPAIKSMTHTRQPARYPPSKAISRGAQQQSVQYNPAPNYSFTNVVNGDYSLQSGVNNYDTFEMTQTYLNLSQNQQESETNKYIDSRTSTRNKVAFFKDSLILIKNETFQIAFKRSSLVQTRDRARVIFFVKNKTSQAISVDFKYEYDASYFKLKVNEKLQTVPAYGQAREDLEVYAYSTLDLNQVIDIMVQVNFDKYGLWMPILWIEFEENQNFKMPDKNQEISIIPDRQFKSYQAAKAIMPLTFGGINPTSQWAYLYGKCKFGPCFIKFIWEINELKIQTNSKWIDLLAFVMHHVK